MKNIFNPVKFLLLPAAVVCSTATAALSQGAGLYPDLRTVIPLHLQIQNSQQREILRFSNGIANTGLGDLRLRAEFPVLDPTQPQLAIQEILDAGRNVVYEAVVSQFEFHPEHNHFHINNVALFEMHAGSPTGTVYGSASVKVTFCLIDWYKMEGNSSTPQRIYFDCNSTYQGLQPGWVDQYHQSTEGQQLDITGAPAGQYYMVSTVNPENSFIESEYTNNTAWTSFVLTRNSQGNPKIQITGNSVCETAALCGIGVPNR